MKNKITKEDIIKAHTTIIQWLIQENQNITRKPITMIESDVVLNNEHFRLFSFMTFYGRGELPPIE